MKSLLQILYEFGFLGKKKIDKHIWDPNYTNKDSTHQAVSNVDKDSSFYNKRKGFNPDKPGERNIPEEMEDEKLSLEKILNSK